MRLSAHSALLIAIRPANVQAQWATAGGQQALGTAVAAMLDDARGWRLAEMRKRRGLTQEQVATRMGVSVARVSQIESGDVSPWDVLNRFITALDGTLKLIVFLFARSGIPILANKNTR